MSAAIRSKDAYHRAPAARPARARRKRIRRVLGAVLVVVMAVLVARFARGIDWSQVLDALDRYDNAQLALALALAVASYVFYGCYDLVGRAYTRHRASPRATLAVGAAGYAFNLNLGSMIGGVAARFRLYTRLGLSKPAIARILALSVATSWLGYIVMAGMAFAFRLVPVPPAWAVSAYALQFLGVVLLGVAMTYLLLCGYSIRRSFTVRAHTLILPSMRMALVQFALAIANWTTIAAIIYVLLNFKIAYPAVLGVLLLAAIAAMITHIPAGLGAMEAVFLALLSPPLAHGELIAALVAYRAIYYLLPLLFAAVTYFAIETRGKEPKLG